MDEEGLCGYLFGEIADNAIRVETRVCNRYSLKTLTVDCEAFATREQILDSILR